MGSQSGCWKPSWTGAALPAPATAPAKAADDAIESTCRQLQGRMKRCGQFWSTPGDEALLCLEMCWRNERWELLFPHAKVTAISNN